MTKLYRTLLVLGILILVISGLNTSNQGINSLTLQNRNPVVGLQNQGNTISIFTLGQSHSYGKQEIVSKIIQARSQVWIHAQAASNYMLQMITTLKGLW